MFSGLKLRDERKRKGMTQDQLASLAGCDRNTVSRLEIGQFAASDELTKKLATALKIPVSALHADVSLRVHSDLSPMENELLAAFRKLSPAHKDRVLGFTLGLSSSGSPEAARAAADALEAAENARRLAEESAGEHKPRRGG